MAREPHSDSVTIDHRKYFKRSVRGILRGSRGESRAHTACMRRSPVSYLLPIGTVQNGYVDRGHQTSTWGAVQLRLV